MPVTAESLMRSADEAGWTSAVVEGSGVVGVRPPKRVESLSVRLASPGGDRFVAVWVDGGFDNGIAQRPAGLVGYRALCAVVRGEQVWVGPVAQDGSSRPPTVAKNASEGLRWWDGEVEGG